MQGIMRKAFSYATAYVLLHVSMPAEVLQSEYQKANGELQII